MTKEQAEQLAEITGGEERQNEYEGLSVWISQKNGEILVLSDFGWSVIKDGEDILYS
jgi:hypothetical protein